MSALPRRSQRPASHLALPRCWRCWRCSPVTAIRLQQAATTPGRRRSLPAPRRSPVHVQPAGHEPLGSHRHLSGRGRGTRRRVDGTFTLTSMQLNSKLMEASA